MAEIVTRSYVCDRCGIALGAEPSGGSRIVKLKASASYLNEAGKHVEWNHLCSPCGTAVIGFIGSEAR